MKALFLCLFLSLSASSAVAADALRPISDISLINQDGKSFSLHQAIRGKYVLLSFTFTRCPLPNMCPLNIELSKRLIRLWEAWPSVMKMAFPLHVLSLTLDPENDHPDVLKKFAADRGLESEHFTFATGDPQKLSDFASEFNVIAFPTGKTVSHNMRTILISPQLLPLKEYKDNEFTPQGVLDDIRHSVNWWSWALFGVALLAIPGLLIFFNYRKRTKS